MPSLPPRKVCDIVQDFMDIKNPPKGHKNDRIKGGREKAIEKIKNQKISLLIICFLVAAIEVLVC